ncbi:MAG: GNAT family N-acetyltransferase [Telluria sp.]
MAYDKNLITQRLTLRAPRHDDAAELFALHSDAEVMRYFSEAPWTDATRAASQIDKDRAAFEQEDYFRFAITVTDSGRFIGNCTLFALHRQNRRGEIGYALQRQHWGQGYMHEALHALLDYAFTEHNLHRLEADIDPRNAGSISCLERLGFVREGTLRERWIVGGEVCDSLSLGLLRREWEALR